MTYEEGILSIPEQLKFKPEILNKEKLKPFKRVIVCGMGGSRLAADLLNLLKPESDIHIHSDFGLPNLASEVLAEALVITNSYSGNTAETISAAKAAQAKGLNLAVVAGGGELLKLAQDSDLPCVAVPHTEMPARMMVAQDLKAIMALLSLEDISFQTDASSLKAEGERVASEIGSKIPLIYVPAGLIELGYVWKVIFNETAKMPAFCNRLPELNHNEIESFGASAAQNFCVLMFGNEFKNTVEVIKGCGINIVSLDAVQPSNIFSSIVTAHWTALTLAQKAGVDPLATPVISKLKSLS